MIDPHNAALIIIDMQHGFIDPTSSLCIAGASATIPACQRCLNSARSMGMPVFHVRREYAVDGSDVEPVRRAVWQAGGKPLSQAQPESLKAPQELAEAPNEQVITKTRFSVFFKTNLDEGLHAQGITTVVLIGTTTPNCVRSSCYDALSLNYNVVVIDDATSSRTPEVQQANIEDMRYIGATVMDAATFAAEGLTNVADLTHA